jgi:hypothetical protein
MTTTFNKAISLVAAMIMAIVLMIPCWCGLRCRHGLYHDYPAGGHCCRYHEHV